MTTMKSPTVVAMLAAMGRRPELRVHIRGAIKNGVAVDEKFARFFYCSPCMRAFRPRLRRIESLWRSCRNSNPNYYSP